MAVNFFDSAGSDLDNLFSANNSNTGALGYLTSGNQDLGNRYFKGSLNRTIGYYDSAGTDIGYTRGKIVAPTGSITITRNNWTNTLYGINCSDGENGWNCSRRYGNGYLNVNLSINNNVPISGINYYLEARSNWDTSSDANIPIYLNINSTIKPTFSVTCGSYYASKCNLKIDTYTLKAIVPYSCKNCWTGYPNIILSTSSKNFNIGFLAYTNVNWWAVAARIVAYVYNDAGGTWITSNEQLLGNYHST